MKLVPESYDKLMLLLMEEILYQIYLIQGGPLPVINGVKPLYMA